VGFPRVFSILFCPLFTREKGGIYIGYKGEREREREREIRVIGPNL
jgi:hypothetical protein